ncbi:hypothetical protein EDD11_002788 [Mortierella claussenii]|nr:hypothetical protein EDD11_002788 [Mortierella claussenii]
MWWLKEVPAELEAFVDTHHSIVHPVPHPQHIQPYLVEGNLDRRFEPQGGVFAFPNQYAKSVVWRTKNNASALEIVSISGKENTSTRQITFQFHAPILPGLHIAPLAQQGGITIALLTVDSVLYRLHISALSHFITRDAPSGYSSALPVKWPISTTPALFKYIGDRQAAVASTNGALFLVKTALLAEDTNSHVHAEVKIYELQDDSITGVTQDISPFQKIRSVLSSSTNGSKPLSFGALEQSTGKDILSIASHTTHDDTLLFTLHRDRTIHVWSSGRRQCLQTIRSPTSPNSSGYVQETIDGSSRAHLVILFNPAMPWIIRVLAYIPTESEAQMSIYTSRLNTTDDIAFILGSISTIRPESAASAGSNTANLITLKVSLNESKSGYNVWGLWGNDTRTIVKYLQIDDPVSEQGDYHQLAERDLLYGRWWPVAMQTPLSGFVRSMSAVDDSVRNVSKHYSEVVFMSGHFSDRIITRAAAALFKDRIFNQSESLQAFVIEALSVQTSYGASKAERERKRHQEIMGWSRFISQCAKLDHEASVPLDISVALDTGYMIIVKQEALSFLTACDDSEILYHTFWDKQFEVAQFIASPPSQLRSTYPRLQDPALRRDLAKVFRAVDFLTRSMTAESANNLETAIAHIASSNGPRNFVDIFSQEYLPRYISKTDMNRARNLVGSCKAPVDVFKYLLQELVHSEDIGSDTGHSKQQHHRCVLPYESLVTASIQQLAVHRYSVAQNIMILLSVNFSAPPSTRVWMQDEMEFMSEAMRVTQSLFVLRWVANQTVSVSASLTTELENQLSQMQVDDSGPGGAQGSHRQRLTGSLLQSMSSQAGKFGVVEFPIFFAIPRAVAMFLYAIGVRDSGAHAPSVHYAGLAQRLSKLGETELLVRFLDIIPTTTSLSYYRGRALLSQGQPAQALDQFMAVTACFGNDIKDVEQELDVMQLEYAVGLDTKLEDYYSHVVTLLIESQSYEQSAKAHTSDAQIRALQEKIIDAALAIGAYERAFNTIMQLPSEGLKKHALKKFIKTVCDNGDGAKLSLFPFNALQDQVEQILRLQAEHRPVLSKPDHNKTLYAYYVYKGEYKKAATTMCQYARRLCDGTNAGESVWKLLTEAGSAYLAAINALHMVGASNSWISLTASNIDIEEPSKRRKLSVTFHGSSALSIGHSRTTEPCKREILQLSDLTRAFALIKAKLLLLADIPAEILPAAFTMTARETQLLLVQRGYFEEATSLALAHDLDLDIVFKLLVDKYLSDLRLEQDELLGKAGLRGARGIQVDKPRSASSLQTLQFYLDQHDNAASSYKYRLAVVECILISNPDFDLPPWLTQHYLKRNPEDLIRLYLRFGALEKAARFASVVINAALKKEELISRHSNARWLPYSLLDEIFAELQQTIANGSSGKEDVVKQRSLQTFKDLKAQLDEDVRLYLENVERESIF